MQVNILDVLEEGTMVSLVIDKDMADKVIGNAKDKLVDNSYMIKHVNVLVKTAQVVLVRHTRQDFVYGYTVNDSAVMLSAITKVYDGHGKLMFDKTLSSDGDTLTD